LLGKIPEHVGAAFFHLNRDTLNIKTHHLICKRKKKYEKRLRPAGSLIQV
jgi:hypothetical protein